LQQLLGHTHKLWLKSRIQELSNQPLSQHVRHKLQRIPEHIFQILRVSISSTAKLPSVDKPDWNASVRVRVVVVVESE
jgi:hypothetical protein